MFLFFTYQIMKIETTCIWYELLRELLFLFPWDRYGIGMVGWERMLSENEHYLIIRTPRPQHECVCSNLPLLAGEREAPPWL